MYLDGLMDEGKVIEADAWARSFLAKVFHEQRHLYNRLESERNKGWLLREHRTEIRTAAIVFGLMAAVNLPDMLETSSPMAILKIIGLIALVVIFIMTFRKPSKEVKPWIDDLQRGQRVTSLCLLKINEYALSENMDNKARFVLRILEARANFVYRPVESEWALIAERPDELRSFQELLHVMACIDEGTDILDPVREDFNWLREYGTGLCGYFFDDLREKLESILR